MWPISQWQKASVGRLLEVSLSMFEFETTPFLFAVIGMPGLPEMLIIGAIFLLIFGGAKLPSLMRNLGRSVNEFKTGIKETPADAGIEDKSDD